jgi:hypothetical protein
VGKLGRRQKREWMNRKNEKGGKRRKGTADGKSKGQEKGLKGQEGIERRHGK